MMEGAMNHKNASQLFSVLVLGGAVMASASDQLVDEIGKGQEVEPICQVSMVQKDYNGNFGGQKEDLVVKTVCLDGKSDEEVLEIVNDAKEQSCFSPFCGCWLG